jgi:hypothetical protein
MSRASYACVINGSNRHFKCEWFNWQLQPVTDELIHQISRKLSLKSQSFTLFQVDLLVIYNPVDFNVVFWKNSEKFCIKRGVISHFEVYFSLLSFAN